MQHQEIISRYDAIAEEYSKRYDHEIGNQDFLDSFLSHLSPYSTILDLGSGTGRFAAYFHQKGFDVIGVELSEKMLVLARKKHPALTFIFHDILEIGQRFSSGSFEGICAAYSLFHFTKQEVSRLIPYLHELLKQHGILFLILQEGSGEGMYQDSILLDKKIFLNLYTEEEIKQLLDKNHFTVLSVQRKVPQPGKFPFSKLVIIAQKNKK